MAAPRYVTSASRPRHVRAEDDFWPETRETIAVIVDEESAVDTGLVDAAGVSIYRVPQRNRVGF